MNERRTIKKYQNRRLYDTVERDYVTLAHIQRLVLERVDFVVIDKESQQDITRSVLLQVISVHPYAGSLMSCDFLSRVIRSLSETPNRVSQEDSSGTGKRRLSLHW